MRSGLVALFGVYAVVTRLSFAFSNARSPQGTYMQFWHAVTRAYDARVAVMAAEKWVGGDECGVGRRLFAAMSGWSGRSETS
jgi:hypothetical protein